MRYSRLLIPTLKEAGIDVEADAWMGMIAPAHTPEAMIAKIQREVVEAIGTVEVRDKLAAQLMEPVGSSSKMGVHVLPAFVVFHTPPLTIPM